MTKKESSITLYHGSENDFDTAGYGTAGAFYLGVTVEQAITHGSKVYTFNLTGANIADFTNPKSKIFKEAIEHFNDVGGFEFSDAAMEMRESPDYDPNIDVSWELFDNPVANFAEWLKERGYDGALLNEYCDEISYAVFNLDKLQMTAKKTAAEIKIDRQVIVPPELISTYASDIQEKLGLGGAFDVRVLNGCLIGKNDIAVNAGVDVAAIVDPINKCVSINADEMEQPKDVDICLLKCAAALGLQSTLSERLNKVVFPRTWEAVGGEPGVIAAGCSMGLDLKPFQAAYAAMVKEGVMTQEQYQRKLITEVVVNACIGDYYRNSSESVRANIRLFYSEFEEAASAFHINTISCARASETADLIYSLSLSPAYSGENSQDVAIIKSTNPQTHYKWMKEVRDQLIENGWSAVDAITMVEKKEAHLTRTFGSGISSEAAIEDGKVLENMPKKKLAVRDFSPGM